MRLYRRIVEKHPESAVAPIAERRTEPTAFIGWADVVRSGPSANRVDVVIMGDGYTLGHQRAFDELAEDVPAMFDRDEVFEEYFDYLNFIRANLVSKDDGVDGYGREEDTALDAYVAPTVQEHVAVKGDAVRKMLAELPEHDGVAICFVRAGLHGTGGNGWAAIGGRQESTVIHEWGHAFASLGDEYTEYTGHRGTVRERPNVSSSNDPDRVPWKHWLQADARGVGIYEGADGRVKGAFKPTSAGCVMGEEPQRFCVVCREALVLSIYRYVDPIDGASPEPFSKTNYELLFQRRPEHSRNRPAHEFEVRVMRPKSHHLEVSWWVVPLDKGENVTPPDLVAGASDRKLRPALEPFTQKPDKTSDYTKTGVHEFELDPDDYEPGRYQVICRVRDTTEIRGEKLPWVLKDEWGLLESERMWIVQVGP